MANLQRRPQQEPDVSIYDPDCAVYTPELIRSWVNNLDACPEFCERLANGFFKLIPYYYAREDGTFPDPPEFWQRNLLSYSFYLGLGVTIFNRQLAQYLLFGLTEGPSKVALLLFSEVKRVGCPDKVQQWHHAVNVLTYLTETISPETTGPDADAELVRERMPVAGLTPAIRLGFNDPEFAGALFEGAVDEKEKCGDEELVARIEWMKEFIFNAHSQEETYLTN